MRFYVAGPMSGIPEYNHPAFHARAAQVRTKGHWVLNPAEMDDQVDLSVFGNDHDALWADCMWRDLAAISKYRIEAIALLDGWENSRGARVEKALLEAMGAHVFYPGDPIPDAVVPHQPMLVGLSGYARSGKDTTAAVLQRLYGYQPLAFADPLRSTLRRVNPTVWVDGLHWPLSHFVRGEGPGDVADWDALKQLTGSARQMMVGLGDGIREIAPDFWLDAAMSRVQPGVRYAVSDCRNPNEADAIRAAGGVVLRVERPDTGPALDTATGEPYRLEVALDDYPFDAVVSNSGSVADLDGEVADVMARFGWEVSAKKAA